MSIAQDSDASDILRGGDALFPCMLQRGSAYYVKTRLVLLRWLFRSKHNLIIQIGTKIIQKCVLCQFEWDLSARILNALDFAYFLSIAVNSPSTFAY